MPELDEQLRIPMRTSRQFEQQWLAVLYFNLVDTLPELGNLRKSALAGCSFCQFLRRTILSDIARSLSSQHLLGDGTLECSFEVTWIWVPDVISPDFGELCLIVYLKLNLHPERSKAFLYRAVAVYCESISEIKSGGYSVFGCRLTEWQPEVWPSG